MPSTNILFEVRPYKSSFGPVTLRMSSAYNGDDKGTQLDGSEWDNLIVSGPNYSFNYTSDQDGRLSDAVTDLGSLQFRVGSFYDNEEWTTYEWNNAACRVWVGEVGQPFSAYRKLYEATCSGLERDGMTASVSLRALTNRLSKPLLNTTYAGTGNAEGPTTMKGTIKPMALGTCLSVEPVIVDAAKWIYQVHGYGSVQDIVQVYDFAQPVGSLVATVNTYAELAALTLKPSEWAKCNALGMFRLGGASDKKITTDVRGGLFDGQFLDTVADLIPALIRLAGFAPAKVGGFSSMANKGWSYYSTEEADIADVVLKAALDAGGYILTNNDGIWQGGDAFAVKPYKVLKADGSEGPTVGSIRELNVADPIYKVFVGHTPCWGVHSTSDISPKLLELAGSLAEQDELLIAVKATADLAKSKSEAAQLEIDNIGADGILDRGEKVDQLTALENAAAERREIASRITIYNATTEFNAYKAAHDALTAYLNPLLADLAVSSAIDRTTFRARWAAYREKHQAVWNAMAGDARTVSTWSGTTGLGKPEDNATVGAKIGTNLIGSTNQTITSDEVMNASAGYSATATYDFSDNTLQGVWALGATLSVANGVLKMETTNNDPILYLPVSIAGRTASIIRVRMRPTSAAMSWQGQVYYGNQNHSDSEQYTLRLPNNPNTRNVWTVVEWDMSNLALGGTDYVDGTLNRLRFDLSSGANETWEIDWIQVGQRMNATYGAPMGSTVGTIPVTDLVSKVSALDAAGLTDTVAPSVPTGLALTSTLTDAGVTFKASWNAVSASDLAGYVIALKEGSGNYVEFNAASNSFERTALPRNTAFTGKVLAYDKAGNRSAFSSEVTITTARDTTPPALFTINKVDPTFETAFVTITAPTDLDIDRVRLDLYQGATLIGQQTQKVAPGQKTIVTFPKLSKATTYQVGGFSFDTSGNSSSGVTSVQFTTAGGIVAGDFTPGLQPIQTVSALPAASGYTGPAVVLLSTDGKLYRYANGAWSKEVQYGDVSGKPTTLNDINSTEATKLSGIKENAGNILDTRNANELPSYYYGKGIGEYQEFKGENFAASGSVGYGHLITTAQWIDPSGGPIKQTLTDSNNAIFERASTSLSAWGAWGKNYNSAQKPRLGNDLVSSGGNILTDLTVLNANQQWSEVAGTGKPADNATVGAPAGTNVGSTAATTIETRANDPATRINNHTVTIDGGKLTAGTVDTNQLKAGSVKTAQLAIGSMTELNPDPGFRDTKFWRNDGIYPGDLGTNPGTNKGYYNVHGNDINTALGTSHYCMLWEAHFTTSGRQHLISTRRYNIKAGTTYQISALVRNASNQTMRVTCRMYDVANAHIADAELRWTAGEWSTKSGQFVPPAGVNNFELFVYNAGGVMWAGNCQIADFQIIEAAGSTAIKDGAITTDKLTAKAVTANKLSVNSRLFSAAELNVRYKDGVLSWDAGNIVYVNDAGGAVYNSVPAGNRTGKGYLVYKPGNPALEVVADYGIRANPDYFTIAYYDGVSGLTLIGGTSTRINGSDIQTETISANRIVSKSIGAGQIAADAITANEIKTGTLTAAQMAAGAVTANVLAVGNSDSIVGDANFTDAKWWTFGADDRRFTVGETGMVENRRELLIAPNGGVDVYSQFFPAEPGATYRINVGVYTYPDFSGSLRPIIHVPGNRWMSLKGGGAAIVDPGGDTSATHNFTVAGAYDRRSFVFTNPLTADAGKWQFRFLGSWTGKAAFTISIVRVGDATLIKDGAVETKHITVGTLDGDRIKVDTLDATKIKAGSIDAGRLALGVKERVYTNLINAPFWGTGDMSATPYWTPNNAAANSWYVGRSPTGGAEPLLGMTATGTDANGGWNTTITESEGWSRYKAYRYYTWFYNGSGNNSYYHGCDNVQSLGGGDIGNPYFFAGGKAGLAYDKWYLFVGVVHPAGSQQPDSGVSGAYDPVTGQRIIPGTDYRWRPTATTGNFRSYQFYGNAGGVGYYTKPVVEEIVAGQTPSIRSLFQNLDYAQNINAGSTQISPGRVLVSDTTSLDDWRDQTEIRGGAIKSNSISAEKIAINARGITALGLDFKYEGGLLHWSTGHVLYTDDNGISQSPQIPAGGVAWAGGSYNYILWDKGAGGFRHVVDAWEQGQTKNANTVIMVTWRNGSNFVANYGGTIISGDRIVTRSISATQIQAGTIGATEIAANSITADRMNVGSLDAVSANIGTLRTAASGQRTEITNNGMKTYNANGVLVFQSGIY